MRTVCFVTGTRAEFGLMRSTLDAIRDHPRLHLKLVVTGMHLDPSRGRSVDDIVKAGWHVDRQVPWPGYTDGPTYAAATGSAMAGIAAAIGELSPDILLVVGDRVEAFAAASAAHLAGLVVAHIHGGDRAMGQADDALRHAITKLAHLHFPATPGSAERIEQLGEQSWRIHQVGAPGIDGILEQATPSAEIQQAFHVEPGRFALLVLHPTRADEAEEHATANTLLTATLEAGVPRVVIVHPNNDPGAGGIAKRWDEAEGDPRLIIRRNVDRPTFLGLMRDAAMLVGNSSAGIIEAGSFGLPVIDVGPRQAGRERGENVLHADESHAAAKIARIWNGGQPIRSTAPNPYGGTGAGRRIANDLAHVELTPELRRKLIAY